MNNEKSGESAGAVLVMQAVFVALKLGGQVVWGWWWVFSPLLALVALVLVVIVLALVLEVV